MEVLRWLKKIVQYLLQGCYRIFCQFIPVSDKKIIFMSFHGRGYGDNPKAIYEAMLSSGKFKDFKFIWILRNPQEAPMGAKGVRYMHLSYFLAMASSRYWVVNCKLPNYIYKKKSQIYLQTWHGTPLKRLGHDIEADEDMKFYRSGLTLEQMRCSYDDDVKKYNYMISPNRFCTKIFPHAFHIEKEKLIETGYPRNDVLLNASTETILNIKRELHIPLDKKVILYAPTWRDNSYVAKGYTFELKANFHKWKKKLGEEYVVLFKPHYSIINTLRPDQKEGLNNFLYCIDANYDISNLYLISDLLITDYSSVFFDYAILNRPIYFYMYDREMYDKQLRGFYLDVDHDLPGEIVTTEDQLLDLILEEKYDYMKLKEFNKEFNSFQDGKSSQKVIEKVFLS